METFSVSFGVVALAEIGDKTQLLALLLAARYRQPAAIVTGIFGATLANHALAGALGAWFASVVGPEVLRMTVGGAFVAMALWALIPDGLPREHAVLSRFGVLAATLVAFFLVETGDKTQVATVALAARFDALALVVVGTTLGMLAANVPVVLFGDVVTKHVPLGPIRAVCAVVFFGLGIYAFVG